MTALYQASWGYESLGPWMTSIESPDGAVSVVLVYSLDEVTERLFPHMDSSKQAVRFLAVDARGQMVFGWDRRSQEMVATKEVMDNGLARFDRCDEFEASIALMSMSDAIRASAQRRGLA